MQERTSDSTFYIDLRDGSIEQHLGTGEIKTFPGGPRSGKSVFTSQIMAYADTSQHKLYLGATRDGMSAIRPHESVEPHRPRTQSSRLLASLLSR